MLRLLPFVLLAVSFATQAGEVVRLVTPAGEIHVELDERNAPLTTKNFLRYLNAGAFAGGSFYRVVRDGNQPDNDVKINVIQGGPNEAFEEFDAIPLESTRDTGLKHKAGTISMARLGPDTATAHFFICVTDEPELDHGGDRNPDGQGFAAFGRVVQGMETVRAIHQSAAEKQALTPAIPIIDIVYSDAGEKRAEE